MFEEINSIKIVSDDEKEAEQEYYQELKRIAEKHGYEANTCDFDFERIYNRGYEDKEDWEDEYICSVEQEIEVNEKSEDETLYTLTAEVLN